MLRILSLAVVLLSVGSDAAEWAVIVAGSNGYYNYRHQADACHAYQLVKAKGIPEDHIILMSYDDVAHSRENPFPGKLFNKPDPTGPGKDVYAGCTIDYRAGDVTPKQFLDVLTGKGSGKVLKSTAEDDVFVNFADHGAPGLIGFPDGELHKAQLQTALQQMHDKQMFKKLVFYLEACESGSMFEGLNVPGVYAVSAANAKESSWGTYCGDEAKVNGKNLGSCLGDLFSIAWMEDSDSEDISHETLQKQFEMVKVRTNKSHVMQWGDLTFTSVDVSEFQGDTKPSPLLGNSPVDFAMASQSAISARHVDLHNLYHLYISATSPTKRLAAGAALQNELARQQAVETAYLRLAEIAYPGDVEKQSALRHHKESPNQPECELAGHAAIRTHCAHQFDANSGFALQFHQVVVNICAAVAGGLNLDVRSAAIQACGAKSAELVV